MTEQYRPQVGQTLFALFPLCSEPRLITVTGYHEDPRFTSEQVAYTQQDGRACSTTLKYLTFLPDAPIDAQFFYMVLLEESSICDESSQFIDEACFFTPEDAFAHIDGIESGAIAPNYRSQLSNQAYTVEVRRV